MKKHLTKIVTTIGPSSENKNTLKEFLHKGVTCFRFNFSHGTHNDQLKKVQLARELTKQTNIPVTLLFDTKGPEIRTHSFKNNVTIKENSKVKIHMNEIVGDENNFSVSFANLINDVKINTLVLVDDGKLSLKVTKKDNNNKIIETVALNTHSVASRRGINLPNVNISLPFLSEKDKNDLIFCCEQKFDWIAASFVNSVDDIKQMRNFINKYNGQNIKICSKIESMFAIENLESIVMESDGIMVARGDLGVEIPYYCVPKAQLQLIKLCRKYNKPVIVATGMLETMIDNIKPSRAEVSDIYFASYFGASSTMLSGESANSPHPTEAVDAMANILNTENHDRLNKNLYLNSCNTNYNESNSNQSKCYINDKNIVELAKKVNCENYDAVIFKNSNYSFIQQFATLRTKAYSFVIEENMYKNYYGFTYGTYKLCVDKNLSNDTLIKKLETTYNFEFKKVLVY